MDFICSQESQAALKGVQTEHQTLGKKVVGRTSHPFLLLLPALQPACGLNCD